jgi:DnaJ-domain-containing protein 1
MELLVPAFGLVLVALAWRCGVVKLLVHGATLCSGVLLYVTVQQVCDRWGDILLFAERSSLAAQLGMLAGASVELVLLGLILFLPFHQRRRAQLEGALQIRLLKPGVYPLVWSGGGLAYHLALVSPHFLAGNFVWAGHDLPLALILPQALLASVLLAARSGSRPVAGPACGLPEEPLAPAAPAGNAAAPEAPPAAAAQPCDAPPAPEGAPQEGPAPVSDAPMPAAAAPDREEEVQLKQRVDALRREAELAERQWAAAVLKERAARSQAERFAREFAEARRKMETQAADRQFPATMSLELALRVLRLRPGCTLTEVKDAYRGRVSKYHPDKVTLFGSQIRETAERETKRINLAYEVVKRSITAPKQAAPRRT